LYLCARRGAPIKTIQKSFRFLPSRGRFSLHFSIFFGENAAEPAIDFWTFGFFCRGPKVQNSPPADGEVLCEPDGWRVGNYRIVKERS
jgi:hypothetical protein